MTEMQDIPPQMVGRTMIGPSMSGSGVRMRSRNAPYDSERTEEDDDDCVEQEHLTLEERQWSLYIALFSGVDVLMSFGICVASCSYAYKDAGVSLWCMAIQTSSHWLSSLMLMLRFWGEHALPHSDDENSMRLLRGSRRRFLVREQIASIVMGLVLLISSAGLLFKAFRKIKFWTKWYEDHGRMDAEAQWALEFLAWYGFSVYFLQAVFRLVAARKLRRQILWHCFVASVISLLFLFVLGFAASYQREWSWKAEPIAAIVLAFVTLAEGTRIVIMHLDDMDTRLRYDSRA